MFVDVISSSALSNRLEPEDLMEVYQAYRTYCSKAITAAGGRVARYIGDGILAYFGYPVAHENDPQRAARAALDIVRGIDAVVTPAGNSLQVRVGIATGRLLAGRLKAGGLSYDDVAVGNIPNLAARLQGLATPNGIVVSEQTWQRVQSRFVCEPLGQVPLAGFDDHYPWRVVGERSQQAGTSDTPPTARRSAFQGRRGELEVLRAQWSRAERRDGNVVLVMGEAGIGKSRLVDQFLTLYLPDGTRVVRLAASALDEDTPVHPFIDFVRTRVGLDPSDNVGSGLAKIGTIVNERSEWNPRLPILLNLLGSATDDPEIARLTPDQLRERTISTLAELLVGLASESPLCLVLEDLHWLDPTSRDLLEVLVQQVQDERILLLLSARNEFVAPWVDRVEAVVLNLKRLGLAHATGLMQSLFGETPVPPDLARRVVTRTDGVPLFIEEVARLLLARQQIAGSLGTLDSETEWLIPASLDESLMARLDRSGPAKRVAQAAAVLGRSVHRDVLAAICDVPSDQLADQLSVLMHEGILDCESRRDRESYRFHHALLRDAAYASLVRDQRKELHARTARALVALDPAEMAAQPEILALHLTEGGLVEEAVPHWLTAARRSLARSALTEATRLLRRSLRALESLPVNHTRLALRIQLSAPLGAALSGLTGPNSSQTQEHYTKALELCRQVPEDPGNFPIHWGWWRLSPGSVERAAALLDRAVTGNNPGLMLQAHHGNWCAHLNTGSFERCCRHVALGLQIYDRGDYAGHAQLYGNHDPKVCAHGARAQAYWMQGRLKSAMDDEVQALSWANAVDHVGSRVHAMGLTILHRVYRRDFKHVFDRAGQLMDFTSDHGLADHGSAGLIFRGWVLAKQGDPAAGLKMLEEGLFRQQDTATSEDFSVYLCLLAEALIAAGQPERAIKRLISERPQFDRSGLRIWLPELVRVTAETMLVVDPAAIDRARGLLDEADELAEAQKVPMLALRVAVSKAHLDLRLGEAEQAARRVKAALNEIAEDDGSADLIEARKLVADIDDGLRLHSVTRF
jgi:class 3 adenylate cyclase/predicted ATPase